MKQADLEETTAGIKIGGRNINNLRYADDTTLLAESIEDLKYLLTKPKTESLAAGLKLNMSKTVVMTTGSLKEFKIDDEQIEIVEDFIFLGSRINSDGNCSPEINRRLMLGRQAMINLDKLMKSRDINLNTKKRIVHAMVFPITTYGCESWTMKKHDRRKVDAFELWCWRRVLRVPWTAKRTNRLIIDEIKTDVSLESSMLKLKLLLFGHIMRKNDSLEKTIMLGKIEGKRRRG